LSSQIQPGPETQITLNCDATLAELSALDTTTSADPQAVGPRPSGNQEFVAIQAGETLSSQLSGSWRASQSLEGRLYRTINSDVGPAMNKSVELDAQGARQWQRNEAGLRGRLAAMQTNAGAQAVQATNATTSGEFAELTLDWRHEWTPDFAHELAAGVFALRMDQTRLLPAGYARLLWRHLDEEVELGAGQTADSNIYLGAAYERRFATLHLGLSINRLETLRLLADTTLEHDTTSSVSNGAQASTDVFSARLAMRWQPGDMLAYGLEYTLRDQHALSTDSAFSPFVSFHRQVAMLTIEAHYPRGL
jgi:hypothetical protein